jgi:hypothetical protein
MIRCENPAFSRFLGYRLDGCEPLALAFGLQVLSASTGVLLDEVKAAIRVRLYSRQFVERSNSDRRYTAITTTLGGLISLVLGKRPPYHTLTSMLRFTTATVICK